MVAINGGALTEHYEVNGVCTLSIGLRWGGARMGQLWLPVKKLLILVHYEQSSRKC